MKSRRMLTPEGRPRMNILVVGSGAREHAIAWRLMNSPHVDMLFIVPGNAGTASVGVNLQGSPEDLEGLVELVNDHRIDLTVVGPEVPPGKMASLTCSPNADSLPLAPRRRPPG